MRLKYTNSRGVAEASTSLDGPAMAAMRPGIADVQSGAMRAPVSRSWGYPSVCSRPVDWPRDAIIWRPRVRVTGVCEA